MANRSHLLYSVLVSLSLSVNIAEAAGISCEESDLATNELHTLQGNGYWMQSAGCYISYTGWGGVNSKLYNRCTRKQEKMTGRYDPAPVPGTDNRVYVHPGLDFYLWKDVVEDGSGAEPFYSDKKLTGVYQSLGLLKDKSENDGTSIVRAAIGWKAGKFQDYEISNVDGKYEVKPIHDAPILPCQGSLSGTDNGLDSETPMLSRDGSMISSQDYETEKTVIYRINEPSNGQASCELVATVPLQTGKISYDYASENILYRVVDPLDPTRTRLMEMNLESGQSRTISSPDENVLYQGYFEDPANPEVSQIMFTRGDIGDSENELVILPPGHPPEITSDIQRNSYLALGLMWARHCGRDFQSFDQSQAVAIGQRLTPQSCNFIAQKEDLLKHLHDTKDYVDEIRPIDVAGLCPPTVDPAPTRGVR